MLKLWKKETPGDTSIVTESKAEGDASAQY